MVFVQDSQRITLSKILFLTDFSRASASALPFAARIARTYGATLTALHVVVPTVSTYMSGEMSSSAIEGLEDFAHEEMKKLDAQLVGAGAFPIPAIESVGGGARRGQAGREHGQAAASAVP